jgi:hypothetical protein
LPLDARVGATFVLYLGEDEKQTGVLPRGEKILFEQKGLAI